MSGIMTDTQLEYMENIPARYIYITLVRKIYGSSSCGCYYTKGRTMPVGIYDLFSEHSRRTSDPNNYLRMKIPGLVTSCYPLNSILESSLECFYDQTCVNKTLLYLPTNETFTAMTISSSSRFSYQSTVQSLVDHLMIEDWITNISYDKYYNQCIPISCTYSRIASNSLLVILTKSIGILSTLTMVLRILILPIVGWIRRPRNIEPLPKIPFKIKLRQLKSTLYKTLIELNLFQRPIDDNNNIRYQYDATRLYIVSIVLSILILSTYKYFDIVMHYTTILNPSESQYLTLEKKYSISLSCPCSSISMPYSIFLKIEPRYHHVCSSDIVSPRIIDRYAGSIGEGSRGYQSPWDYGENGHIHFHFLFKFCKRIQQSIDDALLDFYRDRFVSSTVLSPKIFQSQINSLIEYWKSTIKNQNLRNIDIIQATTHGNQLMSPLLNTNFSFSYVNRQLKIIPMKYSNCSCVLSPSCYTDMGVYAKHPIETIYTLRTRIPTLFIGCYPNEAILASTLECFYNTSCILSLYSYRNSEEYHELPFLNSNMTSSVNETIESIINQLMIDSWSIDISFTKYYQECSPHSCTYQYLDRNSLPIVVTTIMSIIGGLTLGFKFFFILCLIIIEKFKNILSPIASIRFLKNQFACHHEQRLIDRISFIFVTITLITIYVSITFSPHTKFVENHKPSFSTYKKLEKHYSSTLQCSCLYHSIKYETFFNITSRFHHICSSHFVSNQWIEYLYSNGTIFDRFLSNDFQLSAFAQFQLLSSFCKLSQQIVNDSFEQLTKSYFINSQLLSAEQLNEIIQSNLDDLKLTIPSALLTSLALIRETTQVNKLMTSISSNWRFMRRARVMGTRVMIHPIPLVYQGCNCGLSSKCTQSSGGMLVGCYPLEALLQTTFQCLYDQKCIDPNQTFTALNISSLKSSRFTINMTIESIVKELFIEEYFSNISYEKYFHQCSISTCRHSYIDKMNIIDGITNLISLYGGLMIICQSTAVTIVRLGRLHKCRKRTINPDINSNN
ncbi:unnamed protein product [Adineta ricciae]|nr:unnamed protein product [Adineta ricciae]